MSDENLEDKGTKKGFLIGMLVGGVVGAITALLYAPKPGKELRRDIKNRTGELMENAEDFIDSTKTKATDMINEGKRRSDNIIAEAKRKSASILGDAEKIISGVKNKFDQSDSKSRQSQIKKS